MGRANIIATHAPIVLAYPDATIYQLDGRGITEVAYDDAEPVTVMRSFLADRSHLFANAAVEADAPAKAPGETKPQIDGETWKAIRGAWRGADLSRRK